MDLQFILYILFVLSIGLLYLIWSFYKGYRYDFYLAGPMTGIKGHNFPQFNKTAALLRSMGYRVWSPAEHNSIGMTFQACMQVDLSNIINKCNNIFVLSGWRNSLGANCEVFTAQCLGKKIYKLKSGKIIRIKCFPNKLPYGYLNRWKILIGKEKYSNFKKSFKN